MRLRIKRHTREGAFKSLTLDCYSQRELDALGALFNFSPIPDAIVEVTGGGRLEFWSILETAGANVSTSAFSAALMRTPHIRSLIRQQVAVALDAEPAGRVA